ncbi:DUF2167 domain-containing protein [Pontibacter anaerobius]|uniref:DUF2167 domain-containing protein n=1 Tax=Pontibacter anaerobius TaxID=2993940 RepID=A0ABT3RHD7_9BACT|nr:DUF2167 domain-containing protein [Pontibacter anaerobius]MCX2740665.1 DUF2167 domain-containing protein [Pontibacter anaerobius]
MKQLYMLMALFMSVFPAFAQTDSLQLQIQEIENSLQYQYGEISLGDGLAKIKVPEGFKYLDAEQSEYVLTELWGNPASGTTMGMLVPKDKGVLDDDAWVFDIEFDEIGYVEDKDAEDIDYAELLNTMKDDMIAGNEERVANGYEKIQLIGWASEPYYDQESKILHWAKEVKFGEAETNTLNYNVRILGRKGVLMLNAIANMESLPEVKQNIPLITSSVSFEQGHSYFDFNPDVDEVASWTIGGLVAGKVLTKVGFFALLLKFWKVIAVAVAGLGGSLWKRFRGKKEDAAAVEEEVQEKVTG